MFIPHAYRGILRHNRRFKSLVNAGAVSVVRIERCCRCLSSKPTENKTDNIYTIPNALSLSRIVMAPMVAYAVIESHHTVALALFGAAALTDFLDGQIARRFPSQRSLLGSVIDPIGDKLLMGCSIFSLWYATLMPGWYLFLVLSKDLVLLLGGIILKYKSQEKGSLKSLFTVSDGSIEVKPGWHGKINMALQCGAVFACLAAPIYSLQDSNYLLAYLCLSGAASVYSLIRYVMTYQQVFTRVESTPSWMEKKKK